MNQLTMPSKNNPILPWAQEATRQIRAMTQSGAAGMLVRAGVSGSGSEPIPANQRIHRTLTRHPWSVRHISASQSGSSNNSASNEAWHIYLTGSELLIDNALVNPADNPADQLTAASSDFGTGWYVIDNAPSTPTAVYLVIVVPDEEYEPEEGQTPVSPPENPGAIVSFSSTPTLPNGFKKLVAVKLAEITAVSGNSSSGNSNSNNANYKIKQIVDDLVSISSVVDTNDLLEPDDVSLGKVEPSSVPQYPATNEGKLEIKSFADKHTPNSTILQKMLTPAASSSDNADNEDVLVRQRDPVSGYFASRADNTSAWKRLGKVCDAVDGASIDVGDIHDHQPSADPSYKIQLKHWNDPAKDNRAISATSLKDDLLAPTASQDRVLVRTSAGELEYKLIGNNLPEQLTQDPDDISINKDADNDDVWQIKDFSSSTVPATTILETMMADDQDEDDDIFVRRRNQSHTSESTGGVATPNQTIIEDPNLGIWERKGKIADILDNASLEVVTISNNRKVQLKNFTGSNSAVQSGTTLAAELRTGDSNDHVLVRSNGALAYKAIGQLIGGSGSGSVDISALNGLTIVTNVEWLDSGTYAYSIHIEKKTLTVANGVVTVGAAQDAYIATTAHSSDA